LKSDDIRSDVRSSRIRLLEAQQELSVKHSVVPVIERLPEQGFVRLASLVDVPEVTEAQAKRNLKRGGGPTRARPARRGIVAVSAPTWWRMVQRGDAPAPIKLSPGVTAWSVQAIRQWIDERASAAK
jgi:predicted DNA-binding transcriptional regulator AlpA